MLMMSDMLFQVQLEFEDFEDQACRSILQSLHWRCKRRLRQADRHRPLSSRPSKWSNFLYNSIIGLLNWINSTITIILDGETKLHDLCALQYIRCKHHSLITILVFRLAQQSSVRFFSRSGLLMWPNRAKMQQLAVCQPVNCYDLQVLILNYVLSFA